jgi:hypothetical protein
MRLISKDSLSLATALALAVLTSVTFASPAQAERALKPGEMRYQTYDWLAKRKVNPMLIQASATSDQVAGARVQIGRGSYICSPAGFGKKSACYAN